MNPAIEKLERDSLNRRARYDSLAYREILKSGLELTPALVRAIREPSFKHYLSLEALRETAPEAFNAIPKALRVGIYTDALAHAVIFNDWGLPGEYLGDTARAVIAHGDLALRHLAPLLADQRAAPCHGSETATLSKRRHNRVCDYAMVLIFEIRGAPPEYPRDPRDRDAMIANLKRELGLKA